MEKRHLALILMALLAYYAAIHLLVLNNKPFFGDEIWFVKVASEIMESGFPKQETMPHPPAFGYMLAASFKLFGFSEASSRLVPTLFGLLSLVLVYRIGSFLSSSREVGVLAVFILVISKIFMSYTTIVDMDGSAVLFFLLLEIYLILKYLEGEENKLLQAAAALGIGLMFKLGTVAVPLAVLAGIGRKKIGAIKGLLLGIGLFVVMYAAYFMIFYPREYSKSELASPFIHFLSSATAVQESLWKFLGVLFWNSSFPLVVLFGYSLARAVSDKDRKLRFTAWCALITIIAYSLASHKMERYFVPAVPIATLLAANYLFPLIKRGIGPAMIPAVAGFLYFRLLGIYSLSPTNVALSILPLALAALIAYKKDAERFLVMVFGLYVGMSIFTASVYATHDYLINECEGARDAGRFIAKNLNGGRLAFVDATIGFYMGGDYRAPPDLEAGIKDGTIKYYARCKAWPNLSKNALDDIAEKHESKSFYIKSIKIHEFS